LIAAQSAHPYARVGLEGIEEALARFRGLMEAAHYPYQGSMERITMLPTAMGALRPTAFYPITMAAGDLQYDQEMLIAGFHELRDFFPPLIADNLRAQGIAAHGAYLTVPPTSRRIDYTTRTFARLFDEPAFRQNIGEQLRTLRGKARRIGLPAVLGLRRPLAVLQDLQRLSGAQIFEIPTLPPSVPGMRLFTIFRDAISAAGGRMQVGSDVLRGTGENGKLTAIYSEAAAREQEHRANVFLLATGGIAGGGIRTDYQGQVWETALGLPLQAPTSRNKWFEGRFLHNSGHPIFQTGIATDERLRPVDSSKVVVYDNVVAAGSALVGSDPVQERSTTGLALATGWHAGHLLAEMLEGSLQVAS
jgi:glycerol-3-phosphate dehydrogenase subunit B